MLDGALNIKSTVLVPKFLMNDFDEKLSAATGLKVNFTPTDKKDEYFERIEKRNFDAYLMVASTSYHVASESLNLLYKSPKRMADNPNGKVLKAIDRYQMYEGSDQENLREIVEQMTLESEIIPLFYQSSPKFYNSKTVDISKINPNESMTFWRMSVL